MSKIIVRTGVVAVAAAVLTLISGAVAEAHVRVFPDSTAAGGFTKLTFRVPNESATADTTKLTVTLPTDTPLAFVSARPTYGWKVVISKAKLPTPIDVEGTTLTEAPGTVTWTADKGQAIGDGEFQEFALSVGPLPKDVKELAFPAAQTYSDGTVVKWDQPETGGTEPEHPVPSFALTSADAAGTMGGTGSTGSASTPVTAALTSNDSDDDGTGLATGLGIGGLALGLIGIGVGAIAWRKAAALPQSA